MNNELLGKQEIVNDSVNDIKTVNTNPLITDNSMVIRGNHYRISILSDMLLRLEYHPEGIFYDNETQRIYFHGAKAGHKVDALKASDKVCFTVYGDERIDESEPWAPYVQSAVVFGRCRLLEVGPESIARLKEFAMKYYPDEALADEQIARNGRATQMFEITIEHMSGKQVQEK